MGIYMNFVILWNMAETPCFILILLLISLYIEILI